MKQVRAELDVMRAAIDEHVLIELEMFVPSMDERRRIAHRAVETCRRDLREAYVPWIACDSLETDLSGEVHTAIRADLSAGDAEPAHTQLVHHSRAEHVRMTDADIARGGAHVATEAWNERLLETARPERRPVDPVERTEHREEWIG